MPLVISCAAISFFLNINNSYSCIYFVPQNLEMKGLEKENHHTHSAVDNFLFLSFVLGFMYILTYLEIMMVGIEPAWM